MDGDQVVGGAAWLPPQGYPIPLRRQARQLWDLAPSLPWALRSAREASRGQRANRACHHGHPPHYYLRTVGVDPAHQHRGVCRALLAPVLDRADHEGASAFLFTATAENVSWYERLGFQTEAEYHPTPTWPTVLGDVAPTLPLTRYPIEQSVALTQANVAADLVVFTGTGGPASLGGQRVRAASSASAASGSCQVPSSSVKSWAT